ncbi:MAG: hypothetical protein EOP11_18865 [Proteobacteria bacterium]|nr:MAG: hypothetical protein EOP11_18865 [Pseudomonadota bacterium]
MERWIHAEVPAGHREISLPALAEEKGAARLNLLAELLGSAAAKAAVKQAGPYLLDDKLALELKLKGLNLPKSGEVAALSPPRWNSDVSTIEIPENATGIILGAAAAKRLRLFLKNNPGRRPILRPADLIRLSRHFFYEEAIKIVVPTRLPV